MRLAERVGAQYSPNDEQGRQQKPAPAFASRSDAETGPKSFRTTKERRLTASQTTGAKRTILPGLSDRSPVARPGSPARSDQPTRDCAIHARGTRDRKVPQCGRIGARCVAIDR